MPARPPAPCLALLALACAAPAGKGAARGADSADSAGPPRPALARVDAGAAPAVMLLMHLSAEGVTVDEALLGPLWVDLDAAPGPDEAFRTQVFDAAGAELFRRDTPTPALVRDFLAHYSGLAGFDLLSLLPDLGAFHLLVPQLEGAAEVVFSLRDPAGAYQEVGRWDPTRLPTAPAAPPASFLGAVTLEAVGPSEAVLDLTLIGDGYTLDDQAQWQADAAALAARLRSAPPLDAFAGRINLHCVDVVSAERGASYDCVGECRARDTAFRSVFAVNLINELTGSDHRSTTLFQLGQHELDRALAQVPTDLAIVVVNSEKSGGTSIHHAAASTGSDTWTDTGAHELGHLLGLLGDEYDVDDCIRADSMGLPRNIAADPAAPPWAHWIDPGTPLPTPEGAGHDAEVGAFASAYNCGDLYRPVHTCRMKSSSTAEFCPVCAEQLALQITRHADLVALTVVPTAAGDRLELDTLGLDRVVRASTDGRSFTELDEPLITDADELHLEVELRTPLVRAAGGLLTERLHLRRPADGG